MFACAFMASISSTCAASLCASCSFACCSINAPTLQLACRRTTPLNAMFCAAPGRMGWGHLPRRRRRNHIAGAAQDSERHRSPEAARAERPGGAVGLCSRLRLSAVHGRRSRWDVMNWVVWMIARSHKTNATAASHQLDLRVMTEQRAGRRLRRRFVLWQKLRSAGNAPTTERVTPTLA